MLPRTVWSFFPLLLLLQHIGNRELRTAAYSGQSQKLKSRVDLKAASPSLIIRKPPKRYGTGMDTWTHKVHHQTYPRLIYKENYKKLRDSKYAKSPFYDLTQRSSQKLNSQTLKMKRLDSLVFGKTTTRKPKIPRRLDPPVSPTKAKEIKIHAIEQETPFKAAKVLRKTEDGFDNFPLNEEESLSLGTGSWDKFICHPCLCAVGPHQEKYANCTHKRLFQVPATLPRDIWILNMSSNFLKFFNLHNLTLYPNISKFEISNNRLSHILNKPSRVPYALDVVFLSFRNNFLKDLRNVTFTNFPKLQILDMSYNKIAEIPSSLFQGCSALTSLDLSHNKITRIQVTSFDSLGNLLMLSLNHNERLGYRFEARLFQNLQKLQRLHIQCSSNGEEKYPMNPLSKLLSLRELFIDGLANAELGPEMRSLLHLRTLSFSHGCTCFIQNITSSYFENVPFIRTLSFHMCKFKSIDPKAFESIRALESYTLESLYVYNLSRAFEDLAGLEKTSLKSLALRHFSHPDTPCRVLSFKEGRHITNFQLEELELSGDFLVLLQSDFLHALPRTIKRLILYGNKLSSEGSLWRNLNFMPLLDLLDVRNQNMGLGHTNEGVEFDFHGESDDEFRYQSDISRNESDAGIENDLLNSETEDHHTFSDCKKGQDGMGLQIHSEARNEFYQMSSPDFTSDLGRAGLGNRHTFALNSMVRRGHVRLPPNLKIIKASSYLFYGRFLFIHKIDPGPLSQIFFSRSFLTDWGSGWLPSTIEIADVSNNFCNTLRPHFIPENNSLRYLYAQNNYLGPVMTTDYKGELFAHADKLIYLNLATNDIFYLSSKFLKGLRSLQSLLLAENKIQIIDLDFSHTPELSFLGLSGNSITWISRTSRRTLDSIASRRILKMDLSGNPLPCTCDGVELLQWMVSTRVVMWNKGLLTCSHGNKHEFIGDIRVKANTLQRQCISTKYFLSIGVFCGVLFLAFIGGGLGYRNRYRLRYTRNVWLARVFGFRSTSRAASGCRYDAYVVYCEEDRDFALGTMLEELEEKRGHTLCVEDRDFIPGSFTFNNITCAVQNSTVTVLLVSPDFVSDRELEYATQMALMEEYNNQKKREVLLLLNFKRTDNKEKSKDLLLLMQKGRFLDYPRMGEEEEEEEEAKVIVTESIMEAFWDRLSRDIGHVERN